MYLVTGATGNVGGEVVRALAAAGQQVRAVVRDPSGASLPDGVDAVPGDLNNVESLRPALSGVRALFLLPGYDATADLLAAARKAGVQQVVLLSGGSAGSGDLTNAVTRYMVASETAVRESGLAWTMLRPTAFMANALRWLPQLHAGDVVRLPFASVSTATVDPADIAAVAVVALTADGHDGRIYVPTGPQSLKPEDQLRTLAEVLGRDLVFEAQPDDEARDEMLKTTPVEYVDAFFDFYVAGSLDESQVNDTVHAVTGHQPGTFAQWARAHASDFE